MKKLLGRTEELARKAYLRGDACLHTDTEAQQLKEHIDLDAAALVPDLVLGTHCLQDLTEACRTLRGAILEEQSLLVKQRQQQWREATRVSWATNRKEVFRLVKDTTPGNLTVLKRADGTLTCSLQELDELLREEWLPVFRMYALTPEPQWREFNRRFGAYIPENPMTAEPLTPARLRATLDKMDAKSSLGADSWSVAELRLLPDALLGRLCSLFDLIEETGRWPEDLCLGIISPLLKDAELPMTADNTRPITVMSVVYRLWAATRMQELTLWQETWLSSCVASYRPQMGCEDLWYAEALRVEHALLTGQPLA